MSEKGTMTVILKNGTKLFLDYDKRLYDFILRASSMNVGGESITLRGEGWPMEVEFLLSELYSIQVTKIENMCFYPGKIEA